MIKHHSYQKTIDCFKYENFNNRLARFPVTAPFIFAYGLADYAFDIGGTMDNKFGEINTHIYD